MYICVKNLIKQLSYACGLLLETSSEVFNMYLGCSMMIGTLDNPEFGFFSAWTK